MHNYIYASLNILFKEHNCFILEKDFVGTKDKNKHVQVFGSHLDVIPGTRLQWSLLYESLTTG